MCLTMIWVVRVFPKCCWEMECRLPGTQVTYGFFHVTTESRDHNRQKEESEGANGSAG